MDKGLPVFHLRVTKDRMAVLIDCHVPSEDLTPLAEAISNELLAVGVPQPPDLKEIKSKLRRASYKSPHLQDLVLLEGRAPMPPVDSRIEWAGDFFSTGFVVDEVTGAIDYRRRRAQVSVAENQLLARVIPPKDGQDGYNVLGKELLAVKPQKRRIRVGSNVRFNKEEGSFYATANGRIRWINYLLFVDPVYTVPGSVGLETGHISHPGALAVEEDVLEGAKIETQGDIEVKGVIEAAEVRTSGNLMVSAGIIRSEGCRITVAGSIHAKFIIDGDVEAGGDIVVEKEILNSRVQAGGAIIMPKGRIVGGEISAFRGVMAGQIGSNALIPTKVFIADAEKIIAKNEEIKEAAKAFEDELMKIQELSVPLLPGMRALLEKRQRSLQRLLDGATEMEGRLLKLAEELKELRAWTKDGAQPSIEVKKTLHPSSMLYIDLGCTTINDMRNGPLRVVCRDGLLHIE